MFNDGDGGRFVTVVRESDSDVVRDELHLRSGAGRRLDPLDATGRVTVCVYGRETVASASYRPPESGPTFSLRGGAVLVFDE